AGCGRRGGFCEFALPFVGTGVGISTRENSRRHRHVCIDVRYSGHRYMTPRTRSEDDDVAGMLPLPTAVFHILVALADRDRHGYSIMQDVAARTAGSVQLSAGTLYSSIRR